MRVLARTPTPSGTSDVAPRRQAVNVGRPRGRPRRQFVHAPGQGLAERPGLRAEQVHLPVAGDERRAGFLGVAHGCKRSQAGVTEGSGRRPAATMPADGRTGARTIAFVERHGRYWPDPASAASELRRVLGEVDVFLLVDAEGGFEAACAEVPAGAPPQRWLQVRALPAGEYAVSEIDGYPCERLIRRADGRRRVPRLARRGAERRGRVRARRRDLRRLDARRRARGLAPHRRQPRRRPARRALDEVPLAPRGGGGLPRPRGHGRPAGRRRRVPGRPGDFFAKPEGPERAHQFVNDGDRDLKILTIGEHRGDAVEYPPPPWQPGAAMPTPPGD